MINIVDIIRKKRDGRELATDEMNYFIRSVVDGTVTEAQIGAWLMAAYVNGMSDGETADMTRAMAHTGDRLQCKPEWRQLLVDKHSTGGVGDKVSLVLAPALASLGFKVPMISGRGLDITGGTLDKLESIPGFQVNLTLERMNQCLERVGCFIAGQTDSFAPADRILYRIRDSTSTVPSLSFITSSILSKKAAEGISNLVMDIKVGYGGWLKDEKSGGELAQKMIDISKRLNMVTSCVLSNMNSPLGRCVGNSLEVLESVECLRDAGSEDVLNLACTLGGVILQKKGVAATLQDGVTKVREAVTNGRALETFKQMIVMQGVDPDIADSLCAGNYNHVLPKSQFVTRLAAAESGIVTGINAASVGKACWYLSGGRSESGATADYSTGIKLLKLVEEEVQKGEDWIEVHHRDEILSQHIQDLIQGSLSVAERGTQIEKFQRILKVI